MSDITQVLSVQGSLQAAKPKLDSLKQSCEGMESAFLKQIVSAMRKSAGNLHFGKEFGGEMYRDMFDGSIADILAKKGTMGVAKQMFAAVAPRVLNQAHPAPAASASDAANKTTTVSGQGSQEPAQEGIKSMEGF